MPPPNRVPHLRRRPHRRLRWEPILQLNRPTSATGPSAKGAQHTSLGRRPRFRARRRRSAATESGAPSKLRLGGNAATKSGAPSSPTASSSAKVGSRRAQPILQLNRPASATGPSAKGAQHTSLGRRPRFRARRRRRAEGPTHKLLAGAPSSPTASSSAKVGSRRAQPVLQLNRPTSATGPCAKGAQHTSLGRRPKFRARRRRSAATESGAPSKLRLGGNAATKSGAPSSPTASSSAKVGTHSPTQPSRQRHRTKRQGRATYQPGPKAQVPCTKKTEG